MKITFLGTGTSTGVPEIGCQCEVCTSEDKRDWRLRTSVLVETEGKRILLDCGPDFRWQMIRSKCYELNAVLVSHEHYDHVAGMDDLRPFTRNGDIHIYSEENVLAAIRRVLPYVFRPNPYPGVPKLVLEAVTTKPFEAAGVPIIPIRVMHGKLPILGFRIGKMAYLTDVKSLPEEEYEKLYGLDVLILTALRNGGNHPTHQNLEDALQMAERIGAKETYFIHMSHRMGLQSLVDAELPPHTQLAYDGLELSI